MHSLMGVIPAKAGIHFQGRIRARWIPAFAGMTSGKFKRTGWDEHSFACGFLMQGFHPSLHAPSK